MRQQAKYYLLYGQLVTLCELAMHTGVSPTVVINRLRYGMTPETIVSQGRLQKVDEWDLPIWQHEAARKAIQQSRLDGGMTCEEVGAVMGVSRQAVNQMEERALRKLRQAFPSVAEHLAGIVEREARMMGSSGKRRAG